MKNEKMIFRRNKTVHKITKIRFLRSSLRRIEADMVNDKIENIAKIIGDLIEYLKTNDYQYLDHEDKKSIVNDIITKIEVNRNKLGIDDDDISDAKKLVNEALNKKDPNSLLSCLTSLGWKWKK